MEIVYRQKKVERLCKDPLKAKAKYGDKIAKSLIGVINYIEATEHIKSIINLPMYNFHKYENKDYFSIDIGGRKSNKRLLIELMDSNKKRFEPCNIDEICDYVKCIFIVGVKDHDSNKRV